MWVQELRIKLKKQEDEQKILEAEKKKKEELKEQQRLEVIREAQAERDRRVQVESQCRASVGIVSNYLFRIYLLGIVRTPWFV